MSTRTRLSFDVKLNKKGETINIQISDPSSFSADNLALSTWGSSEVLANVLHRLDVDLSHTGVSQAVIGVLELGAGTGLVGLSAACIWKTQAHLTDLPPLLPAIEANMDMNKGLLSKHEGVAVVGMLDWSNPEYITFGRPGSSSTLVEKGASGGNHTHVNRTKARVIVAADTVYSEEHPELLMNVVKARLDNKQEARFIMCYPLRVGYLDFIRDLWARLEEAELVCIQEGREKIDECWDEDTPYEWCVWRWQNVGPALEAGQRASAASD